ncbi:hypothetical protein F383_21132 [Gossypium arboreum]|uniref:Uncharacterized protein n=1 Tax=Gossypium arboreum TaxID=29729 RepID=A0A0B0NNQ0_GOSAR|nr:hypothetical protein F383_21132 [Gossypium arboreum]
MCMTMVERYHDNLT